MCYPNHKCDNQIYNVCNNLKGVYDNKYTNN